ncbi:AAA family ATPase [Corallococcus exiguus]|nr:AAA family ATPase [Corallococcus exiguus]NRD65953.1 AAA family ATPase [Corallococcus exiguus]RKH97253.1 chromosome segregation protein SMC [Corallococcus sp. AB030]
MPSAENAGSTPNHPGGRPPFITRVMLSDYRSIRACDVTLGPLTFLVGPNGSGKSNFMDALRFVTDALRSSLEHALRDRGGINELTYRGSPPLSRFGIRIDFQMSPQTLGSYSLCIGELDDYGDYVVLEENCAIGDARFRVREGVLIDSPSQVAPPASKDRLYLVNAAGLPEFRAAFDALSNMGFYNLHPDQLRALQPPGSGERLARDGSNLPSVLERLEKQEVPVKQRIEEYLKAIVPNLDGVSALRIGHMETLEFNQWVAGLASCASFPPTAMSDGTLRALGILVALFQTRAEPRLRLVGIEEPEIALHPAAAGVLRDALRDASQDSQIIVTSHSPELLDDPSIQADEILSVVSDHGRSIIAPVDAETRSALKDRLYTAGELLKANQLSPDRQAVPQADQLKLWEHGTE